MCRRRLKAGASPRNASKLPSASLHLALRDSRRLFRIAPSNSVAHLRQRFAGDGKIDQDDLFCRRVNKEIRGKYQQGIMITGGKL